MVFHPDSNFNGDVQFGYKVSDGNAESGIQTATLHVTPVNDPAQISVGSPAMVRELSTSGVAVGSLVVTDADGTAGELFNAQAGLQGMADTDRYSSSFNDRWYYLSAGSDYFW